MAAILDSAFYPSIRAAIDITLDSTVLPDATIEMPIFKDAADLQIKKLVTDWSAILAGADADAITHLKNATIYLTAALLVGMIPNLMKESFIDYAYTNEGLSVKEKITVLRGRVDEELAEIEGVFTDSEYPTVFAAAAGNRLTTRTTSYFDGGWN